MTPYDLVKSGWLKGGTSELPERVTLVVPVLNVLDTVTQLYVTTIAGDGSRVYSILDHNVIPYQSDVGGQAEAMSIAFRLAGWSHLRVRDISP